MNLRNLMGRGSRKAAISFAGLLGLVLTAHIAVMTGSSAEAGQNPKGVVELFTSQGCNSCPPADEVLADLAKRGDVVALAYHVDYWDYLGWRDTFGQADNTDRQKQYMKSFGTKAVYTPQAVINGRIHVNGADREEVQNAISDLNAQRGGLLVNIKATRNGSTLKIDAEAAEAAPREAEVVLVYFDPPTPVEIERGENTGKTVTYFNAVTDIQVAGMWNGKSTSFEMPMREVAKNGNGGCAVLLQSFEDNGMPGPIIGATVIREAAQ